MADLRGRPWTHQVLRPRPDHCGELWIARGRVAVQDRQPRPTSRVSVRVHAADGQGRAVLHGRHTQGRRGAGRDHRRAAMGVQPQRRGPGHGCAPAAVGPRPGVLDRRQGGTHPLCDARLSARGPGRGHRAPGAELRPERHPRPQAADGSGHRSAVRRNRPSLHPHRREGCRHCRRSPPLRRRADGQEQREGLHPRLRRAHRQAALDLQDHSLAGGVRQRHLAERLVVLHGEHRRVVADQRRRRARPRIPARRVGHW